MTESEANLPDLKMDAANLYREEVFSDQQIGTIRRLTPVNGNGATDPDRDVRYVGQTQLMTPAGALPLTFEIEAGDLDTAVSLFGKYAEAALEQTMQELQEMRRQQGSSIVMPGAGNQPGGNKIQIP